MIPAARVYTDTEWHRLRCIDAAAAILEAEGVPYVTARRAARLIVDNPPFRIHLTLPYPTPRK